MWGEPLEPSLYANNPLNFNSLAPCGANQLKLANRSSTDQFQLTRPVWGEPAAIMRDMITTTISTHSPRVGRTQFILHFCWCHRHFNSLAPCGANRTVSWLGPIWSPFQLTRPVWGEPKCLALESFKTYISTHSPRVGRTNTRPTPGKHTTNFNSLAPCGANRWRS